MAVEPKPTPPNSNSNSTTPSPYITAPSSPKDTNSNDPAPTYFNLGDSCSSAVPFNWEEKPGKPKSFDISSNNTSVDFDDTFAFDFSGIDHSESFSLSAEELFDDGKIKPLKPPPRLQRLESELIGNDGGGGDSASQRSLVVGGWSSSGVSHSKRMITRKSAWSRRSCDFDPFEAAFENTRKEARGDEKLSTGGGEKDLGTGRYCCSRGRGRAVSFSKLREFLSFRRRVIVDGDGRDSKGSSFRSTGSSTSASSASYSGSIHELYGGVIPYKQRVLGCLGFNRTVHGLVKMI